MQEIQYHVAALGGIARIHGHLSEKIAYLGMNHRERAETVPQIVENIYGLHARTRTLIFESDKAPAQFYGVRQIVFHKLLREVEHMACGYARASVGVHADVRAADIAVSSENLTAVGVPHYELAAGRVHGVETVNVATQPRAAAGGAECYFTQPPHLAHRVWSTVRIHHIKMVAALVGVAEKAFRGEFTLNKRCLYWRDYSIHSCFNAWRQVRKQFFLSAPPRRLWRARVPAMRWDARIL